MASPVEISAPLIVVGCPAVIGAANVQTPDPPAVNVMLPLFAICIWESVSTPSLPNVRVFPELDLKVSPVTEPVAVIILNALVPDTAVTFPVKAPSKTEAVIVLVLGFNVIPSVEFVVRYLTGSLPEGASVPRINTGRYARFSSLFAT